MSDLPSDPAAKGQAKRSDADSEDVTATHLDEPAAGGDDSTTGGNEPTAGGDEHRNMKRHVIRGILLVGVASVFMRGGGLIAQVFAGRLLSSGDFGLFAITLGFTTLSVASLSALRPLFIERLTAGQDVEGLWRLMLVVMIGLSAAMAALAQPLALALGQPGARNVLLAMAPTLPLQFAQVIGIARLAAGLRFSESSKILTIAALVRHGSLIVFALAGFGVYSLVLPLYVEAVTQGALLWRASGRPPALRGEIAGVFRQYGSSLRWLLLSAVALAASLNGDYLAISPFETAQLVGYYFFGYQLSAALTQPFTMAATNVLVPSFATVKDRSKLQSSYLDAISVLLLITGMAFGGLALVGGPLIDAVWSGKWNDSIIAMVLISAGTPFRILQPTCYSLVQSLGRWDSYARLVTFNATFAVGGAVIGALLGGLFEIALMVGLAGFFVGVVVAVIAGRHIGIAAGTTMLRLLRGALPPTVGLGFAFGLFPELLSTPADTMLRVAVFAVASLPLTFLLFRSSLTEIVASVRRT